MKHENTNTNSPDRARLEELCSMMCDGRLTEVEMRELDRALAASSEGWSHTSNNRIGVIWRQE